MKQLIKKTITLTLLIFYFIGCAGIEGEIPSIQEPLNGFFIDQNTRGTQSIYSCDIDGDGDNDIVAAASEDHDIIWWSNDGGSPIKWTKHIVDNRFLGAGSVYALDINKDGFIDIISGAKGGNEVACWQNDGNSPPNWSKHTIENGYDFPHEVYAEDLDSDGNIDVLAASSNLGEITWWKNNGNNPPQWTMYTIDNNFTQAKSVHAADINQDGLIDVIGASLGNNEIIWWENTGTSPVQWRRHLVSNTFSGSHRVQAVDIDKDGDIDIVGAAWYGNEIAFWENDGQNPPSWIKHSVDKDVLKTCMGYATDIDGDSDIDIVGNAQDGDQVIWWRNDGGYPIKWTKFILDDSFDRVWPVYAIDLDNNGIKEIVAASGHRGTGEIKWYKIEN